MEGWLPHNNLPFHFFSHICKGQEIVLDLTRHWGCHLQRQVSKNDIWKTVISNSESTCRFYEWILIWKSQFHIHNKNRVSESEQWRVPAIPHPLPIPRPLVVVYYPLPPSPTPNRWGLFIPANLCPWGDVGGGDVHVCCCGGGGSCTAHCKLPTYQTPGTTWCEICLKGSY